MHYIGRSGVFLLFRPLISGYIKLNQLIKDSISSEQLKYIVIYSLPFTSCHFCHQYSAAYTAMRLTDFTIGKLWSRIYYKQDLQLLTFIAEIDDLILLHFNQKLRIPAEDRAQVSAPSPSISTSSLDLIIFCEQVSLFRFKKEEYQTASV